MPPSDRTNQAKPRDAASDAADTLGEVVAFLHHHFPGEDLLPGAPEPAPTVPPVNVDVPYVEQGPADMGLLTCTMGNWEGEPDTYAYQWKRDGTNIGTGSHQYVVTTADVGKTLTCVVTAGNEIGSTTAPPSNGVVVKAPATLASKGA